VKRKKTERSNPVSLVTPEGKALLKTQSAMAQHAAQLEQEVQDSTTQLRETIGELEAFSYSVSHDMRGPLRAMQGYASHLVNEYGSKLDARGIDYLQRIMRSAIQLDRFLQDVLDYTKSLHSPVPMQQVDLDRLVRDLIKLNPNEQPLKPHIRIKGKLPMVTGNETLLNQCVSNLLSNATKFVAPATIPHLEISSQVMDESMIRIWFKDNGIGIAPENHQRIFRLFERVHPASEFEGSGMGLNIVRKAAERMGALVGLESKLGEGAKFWIQLRKG
jgi:signal transduction histidine kinase